MSKSKHFTSFQGKSILLLNNRTYFDFKLPVSRLGLLMRRRGRFIVNWLRIVLPTEKIDLLYQFSVIKSPIR